MPPCCPFFVVPAFAEDAPTEVVPYEYGGYKSIGISTAGNYIISRDYTVTNVSVGNPVVRNVTLTIAKGASLTVEDGFNNFGTINVCGTLIISDTVNDKNNSGPICVFGCGGGTMIGEVNDAGGGTVSKSNEHHFEDGKCACGTYECEVTGNHNWVNGVCSACGVKGCEIGKLDHKWVNGVCSVCGVKGCEIGELDHNWVNGVCSVCGVKGCEIGKLDHKWVNGVCSVCGVKGCEIGKLDHNWVNGVCSVCDKHCEHKWDSATGKCTVCEFVCNHEGDKCDICGKGRETIPAAVYAVTANANDSTMGSVTSSKAEAKAGEGVTLTATANEGYKLVGFTSADVKIGITGNEGVFTMPDKDVTVTANFEAVSQTEHTVTVVSNYSQMGSASASVATAKTGDVVTLSNTPTVGNSFVEYISGDVNIEGNSFRMLDKDVTVIAIFKANASFVNNTSTPVQSQKNSDNTAILRFMWGIEKTDDAYLANVGAYIIPWDLFEAGSAAKPAIVLVNKPTMKNGDTFSADYIGIPDEDNNYDTEYCAIPFINGTFFTGALLKGSVNNPMDE